MFHWLKHVHATKDGFLMSSSKDSNLIGPVSSPDGCPLAAKRKNALLGGHRANYVLYDMWFTKPTQLIEATNVGLD